MPEEPLAFIFPAFVTEYPVDPISNQTAIHQYFSSFLQKAAAAVDPELMTFDFMLKNFLDDELRTQFMTYILCCSYAEFLKEKRIIPSMCAGYSMGIYAAAYAAGSISFEDGLMLVRQAFLEISRITDGKSYGMGTILGLGMEDISRLIMDASGTLEVANQNSPYSFILSGSQEEVKVALYKAQEEGALNIRMLNVTIPYHSAILKGTKIAFSAYIECLAVKGPAIPVISLIDQSVITDSAGLKKEIIRNLYTRLNWYQTQLSIQNSGMRSFVECGPGKSLVKNAKFVEGEIPFYSASSLVDS